MRLLLILTLASCGAPPKQRVEPELTNRAPDAAVAESTPLEVGAGAPTFALVDDHGATRTLDELHVNGPAVVVFFHGAWCESCRTQLQRIEERRAQIETLGGKIAAISADPPTKAARLVESLGLGFPVLADEKLAAARAFGVTEPVGGLSLAAIFVVDTAGVVTWRHIGEGATVEDQVVDAVRALAPPP